MAYQPPQQPQPMVWIATGPYPNQGYYTPAAPGYHQPQPQAPYPGYHQPQASAPPPTYNPLAIQPPPPANYNQPSTYAPQQYFPPAVPPAITQPGYNQGWSRPAPSAPPQPASQYQPTGQAPAPPKEAKPLRRPDIPDPWKDSAKKLGLPNASQRDYSNDILQRYITPLKANHFDAMGNRFQRELATVERTRMMHEEFYDSEPRVEFINLDYYDVYIITPYDVGCFQRIKQLFKMNEIFYAISRSGYRVNSVIDAMDQKQWGSAHALAFDRYQHRPIIMRLRDTEKEQHYLTVEKPAIMETRWKNYHAKIKKMSTLPQEQHKLVPTPKELRPKVIFWKEPEPKNNRGY